ncbi:MAG: carboxypeptidase regulatory-like domain-containing protein [Pseudomonadota bacterium]
MNTKQRIALLYCSLLAVASCTNHAPYVSPVTIAKQGKPIRIAQPGDVVSASAEITDPNDDQITVRWYVSEGRLLDDGLNTGQWQLPTTPGTHLIRLRARDEHGLVSESRGQILIGEAYDLTGVVTDEAGAPLPNAKVSINGKQTITDANGRYALALPAELANAASFSVAITKPGHMPVYTTRNSAPTDNAWALGNTTSQQLPGNTTMVLTDPNAKCKPPPASLIDWDRHAQWRAPRERLNSGNFEIATIDTSLQSALDFVLDGGDCPPGASVSIPAAGLSDPLDNSTPAVVDLTLGTVDLTTPDSMPGNRAVEGGRYMISAGAAVIEARSQGRELTLNDTATLTVPLAGVQRCMSDTEAHLRERCAPPPEGVRVLVFDREAQLWRDEGPAKFDSTNGSFKASLSHFSEFNMDQIKDDPGCLRIDSQAIAGPLAIDLVVPNESAFLAPTYAHREIENPPGDQIHAFFNLPPETDVGLIAMRKNPSPTCPGDVDIVPLGVFAGITSAPVPGGFPSGSLTPPYPQCGSMVVLADLAAINTIIRDGSGIPVGWHAAVFAALADPSTDELLPLDASNSCNFYPDGSSNCSVIGIVDSGSTRTRLQVTSPNRLTQNNFGATDASLLAVTDNQSVNLRLNGISARAGNVIPEAPGAGQFESAIVSVDVPGGLDLTLIGADVIRNMVARIDYTNVLVGTPEITGSPGIADVTLYEPGSSSIPDAEITLDLDPFPALGSAQPPRFYLRNFELRRGCNRVFGQPNPEDQDFQFLFDTGSTVTVVNDAVATKLGLILGPGGVHTGGSDCFAPGDQKGYALDLFTANGIGGVYQIENPVICWDESRVGGTAFGRANDGIIGSNLFNAVEIILDGSNSSLGLRQ